MLTAGRGTGAAKQANKTGDEADIEDRRDATGVIEE